MAPDVVRTMDETVESSLKVSKSLESSPKFINFVNEKNLFLYYKINQHPVTLSPNSLLSILAILEPIETISNIKNTKYTNSILLIR